MSEWAPLAISVVLALIGAVGGFAALLKVNADNSGTISNAASGLVSAMSDRLDDTEERLDTLEEYAARFDDWGDKVVALLDRAIMRIPAAQRESFRTEAMEAKLARPPRPKR